MTLKFSIFIVWLDIFNDLPALESKNLSKISIAFLSMSNINIVFSEKKDKMYKINRNIIKSTWEKNLIYFIKFY